MSRRAPLLLALLAGAALAQTPAPPVAPPPPDDAARAPLAERLGWNARERTAAGTQALERGDAAAARAALDRALRLRPEDPALRYNAGTGRLADGDPSAGVLLDLAAREAPPELAPSAWYNLGDARLAAKDFQGAAQAFVESLKRRPGHAGAKHNLELALRELEKQREQQQQQQQGGQQPPPRPDQEEPGDDQERPQGSDEQKEPRQPPQDEPSPEQGPRDGEPQDRPQQDEPGGEQPRPGEQGPSALPQFRDLPDMTAEQAAAILRAVENLERQQRKERAAKAARARRAAVEIDW